MTKHLVVYSIGLLLCLPGWVVGQECTATRQEYNRLTPRMQAPAANQPMSASEHMAEQKGLQLQDFLTNQIRSQLEVGPTVSAARRVQAWLRCVQHDVFLSGESNVPWAAALDATGNEIVVAEYIRLGVYASLSRAYLQVWAKGPDRQWKDSIWIRPGTSHATFHAWRLRSPVSGEHWFLESAEAISADGNNPTRIDVVRWRYGKMSQVWSTPGDGVFHTRVVSVKPTEIVLRSSFGAYAHRERDLLRTFIVTPKGLEQTEAQYVYFPGYPPGSPLRPGHLVPLTEPNFRGSPQNVRQSRPDARD